PCLFSACVLSESSCKKFGNLLNLVKVSDYKNIIQQCLKRYEREISPLNLFDIEETVKIFNLLENILYSNMFGSIIILNRSGTIQMEVLKLATYAFQLKLLNISVGRNYNEKVFCSDIKQAIHMACVEDEKVLLLIEQDNLINSKILPKLDGIFGASSNIINLFNNKNEMSTFLQNIIDSTDNMIDHNTIFPYIQQKIDKNLKFLFILDLQNSNVKYNLSSSPSICLKSCYYVVENLSDSSRKNLIRQMVDEQVYTNSKKLIKSLSNVLVEIDNQTQHYNCKVHPNLQCVLNNKCVMPNKFISFIKTFNKCFNKMRKYIDEKFMYLNNGVKKLDETTTRVSQLEEESAKKAEILKQSQMAADKSLVDIKNTIQNASDHKKEMQSLQEQAKVEGNNLSDQTLEIKKQMAEIKPQLEMAEKSVSNIKSETLGEIRALRVPPEIIRDILEGVLRLMGIFDTSWQSMKTFLGKRSVKEEILNFDARKINSNIRKSVEKLIKEKHSSFDLKNARRASQAVEPLAAWVIANVKYSAILEKIMPLETEKFNLERSVGAVKSRITRLEADLSAVEETVSNLNETFKVKTTKAMQLEIELDQYKAKIDSAGKLVSKLGNEYKRWKQQLIILQEDKQTITIKSILVAALATYTGIYDGLARENYKKIWDNIIKNHLIDESTKIDSFSFIKNLFYNDNEILEWHLQGLNSDDLSLHNALIIKETCTVPLIIDPTGNAINWICSHYTNMNEKNTKIVDFSDNNFPSSFEMSVRLGKTLIVNNVSKIEPFLMPILKNDIIYR
ncbi:hypothetical protein A3Q56_08025, partial [Intoshia linei]